MPLASTSIGTAGSPQQTSDGCGDLARGGLSHEAASTNSIHTPRRFIPSSGNSRKRPAEDYKCDHDYMASGNKTNKKEKTVEHQYFDETLNVLTNIEKNANPVMLNQISHNLGRIADALEKLANNRIKVFVHLQYKQNQRYLSEKYSQITILGFVCITGVVRFILK